MAVNETFAELSNNLVYGSMAAYTVGFLAFAASMATRGRAADPNSLPAQEREKATAHVGAAQAGADQVRNSANASVVAAETDLHSPEDPEPGRRFANIGMSLTWLATGFLLFGIIARGASVGRAPWGNMYEYSLTSAFAVAAIFLILSLRRDLRWLGVFVTGAVLLTLGLAVTVLYADAGQLVPALQSYWLVIHVLAAIISGGAFTIGTCVTVLYLVKERSESRALAADDYRVGWLSSKLPESDRLDTIAYRTLAFVFPLWTFAVIAGAIWAEAAWGRYWGWDPKETWAFITWVVYAGYLHARATAGWRGRKAAYVALLGFVCFLINYFGVNMFAGGLHSYAGL